MPGAPFRSFQDAYDYIARFTNYERMTDFRYTREALDLERVRTVLRALEHPNGRYPIVHVAGTKGKGSVCGMIGSMLKQAGFRVGLFTTPHLVRLNERVSIDGREISHEHFVEMMNDLYPHLEEQRQAGCPLTFFDINTILALSYFARQRVDFAVIEVGVGGRLDSTNVVSPAVTVITNVDFDHTHLLGETLVQIAREKAGIIKRRVPVVSGVADPGAARVVAETAEAHQAPLHVYHRDFSLHLVGHEAFEVRTWRGTRHDLVIPLLGAHQRRNAAIAVAAVEALSEALGMEWDGRDLREGLAEVQLAGRIEVVREQPLVILDGAHNPASLRALRETLLDRFPEQRWALVLGMSRDKDLEGNLLEILPLASFALFTATGSARSADAEALKARALRQRPELRAEAEPEIGRALSRALAAVQGAAERGRGDLGLCVTGSFYLAGEAAARWARGLEGGAGSPSKS